MIAFITRLLLGAPPRERAISPDDVFEDAEAGRLIWDQISEEQRRKHWGAL